MEKLKPCPFCGEDKIIEILQYSDCSKYIYDDETGKIYPEPGTERFHVHCFACSCDIRCLNSKQEAIEVWNTRYQHTCQMFPDEDYDFVTCSACGYEEERNLIYPADSLQEFDGRYCPNCGAKVVE